MDTFTPEMLSTQQLMDNSFLSTQFNMDDLAFHLQDPNSLKGDLLGDFMDPFEDISFRDERALSFSGASSQSMSPQPHNRQIMPSLPELSGTNPLFTAHMEPISPTNSMQSLSPARKDSIDDDHRAEVCLQSHFIQKQALTYSREGEHKTEPLNAHIVNVKTKVSSNGRRKSSL